MPKVSPVTYASFVQREVVFIQIKKAPCAKRVAVFIQIKKAPLCKGGCQLSIAMLTGGLFLLSF